MRIPPRTVLGSMKSLLKTMTKLVFFAIFFLLLPLVGQSQELSASLSWSANTYVPLDYPGRPLPSRGSEVEIAVQLHDPSRNPQNLSFDWLVNDQLQKDASGPGKNTFRFVLGENISKIYAIKAKIANPADQSTFETNPVALRAREPEVIIQTPATRISSNQSAKIIAQPFFFDIAGLDRLNYEWVFNNQLPSSSDNEPNALLLEARAITKMTKQLLKVFAENKDKKIQRGRNQIELTFTP